MARTLIIEATWRTSHVIDLDDLDVEIDPEIDWNYLNEWPEEVLEQVDSGAAELTDWEVHV